MKFEVCISPLNSNMENRVRGMLKTRTVHFSYALDGGGYGGVGYNASMSGYTPIALQGYSTGNHHVQVASVSFNYIALKNTGSSYINGNGDVNILYIKQPN